MKHTVKITLTAALLALTTIRAFAIDIDAGDYTALPDGTNVGLLYAQHAQRNRLYSQGSAAPGNNGLNSDIGILRGVHFMKIGGFIVDPQFLLPFGQLKATGDLSNPLGKGSGVGDLILAATVWVVNDPANRTYLGITPFLYAPTGSYDVNKPLNLGENRWKYALQVGAIFPVSDKITIDLAADVTAYGRNNNATPDGKSQKQSVTSQMQAFARYALTPLWDIRAGASWSHVGNQTLADTSLNSGSNNTKIQLGTAIFISPTTQLLATWGQDIKVTNGFHESSRINLRLLQIF